MSERTFKKHRIPCSVHNIAGIEHWLSDMAKQGFKLVENGLNKKSMGMSGRFEVTEPSSIRYKVLAERAPVKLFGVGDGRPSLGFMTELNRQGWLFVSKVGEFYVFSAMSDDAMTVELDLEVVAGQLKGVIKRDVGLPFALVLVAMLLALLGSDYRELSFTSEMVERWIEMGYNGWMFSFWVLGVVVFFAGLIVVFVWYRVLRRRLLSGDLGRPVKNPKWSGLLGRLLHVTAGVLLSGWIIINAFPGIGHVDKVPVEGYSGDIPFATIADMLPEGSGYRRSEYLYSSHGISVKSDIFAPTVINIGDQFENAGNDISMNATYIEAASPQIAMMMADYYIEADNRLITRSSQEIPPELLDHDLDMIQLYRHIITSDYGRNVYEIFIIVKGNKVAQGFLRIENEADLSFEQAIVTLAESL